MLQNASLSVLLRVAFAALLGTVACGQSGGGKAIMQDAIEARDGGVALRAQVVALEQDRIVVSYEFRNESSATVFLFDQLWVEVSPAGAFAVEAGRAWVEVGPEETTISAKLVPVPEGMFVESPNIPLVTRVEPGGTRRGQLQAAIPLRTDTPYSEIAANSAGARPRPLWLEIGYFSPTPGGAALAEEVITTSGAGLRFAPFPIDGQRVLRVGPLHEAVLAID